MSKEFYSKISYALSVDKISFTEYNKSYETDGKRAIMLISTKGRYAVRMMLDVAQNQSAGAVKISQLSARQGISVKYAEQIAGMLTKAGLLRSLRGAGGGYLLTKQPQEYTVYEILRHTEGELAPVDCVLGEGYCLRECAVRGLWNGLYGVMKDYLEQVTLADLAEGKQL